MVAPFKRSRGATWLPPDQHRFNQKLASVRVTIEHTFGMLKSRFQSLTHMRTQLDTQLDIQRALNWIRAMVILHNYLTDNDDDDFFDDIDLALFKEQSNEVQVSWNAYVEATGRDTGDSRRQWVKAFAETRNYAAAYADEEDDEIL